MVKFLQSDTNDSNKKQSTRKSIPFNLKLDVKRASISSKVESEKVMSEEE